ncbi:MAG TPA: BrnT family toxin [Methylomirabilota bacterium]
MEFEWDRAKREQNIRSHGVDFTEAEKTFEDRHAFFQFDGRHSLAEDRFFLLGKTRTGQLLMTVFTLRGVKIRIISSRRASRQEATGYEERIRLQ